MCSILRPYAGLKPEGPRRASGSVHEGRSEVTENLRSNTSMNKIRELVRSYPMISLGVSSALGAVCPELQPFISLFFV